MTEKQISDLTALGAAQVARRIAAGELTSSEVVEAQIERIDSVNPQLNALIVCCFDEARRKALQADEAFARGQKLGPLHGVPVTVKECFDVAGTRTTLGVAGPSEPATADAALVRRLKQAGAIVLGKTNVPQLMLMHETDNPVFGRTNHPFDPDRSPGGSSGGEAAMIAAHGSPLGLGTDLGGSIRQPAHGCGICGLLPTGGRLTLEGVRTNFPGQQAIAVQPGPLARCVEDLMLAMKVLVGSCDAVSNRDTPPVAWRDPTQIDVSSLRMAYWDDDGIFTPSPAVRRAVEESAVFLRECGARVERIVPPALDRVMPLYLGILSSDATAGLRRATGGNPVDWRLRRLFLLGRLPRWMRPSLAALMERAGQRQMANLVRIAGKRSVDQYWQMTAELRSFSARFTAIFTEGAFDAMLFPPHALAALRHGASADLLAAASYCFLPNLLSIPAGVVPITRVRPGEESDRPASRDRSQRVALQTEQGSAGLPVGVQVAAPHWREDVVLAVMQALEQANRTINTEMIEK